MGMLYRKDILDKHGITSADDVGRVRRRGRSCTRPTRRLPHQPRRRTRPASGTGLLWQAGAKPFAHHGRRPVTVNVNDQRSKKIGDVLGGPDQGRLVSTDPDFTDAWYQALNQGKYATWLTAAWGPVFLTGSAKATSGKWRAAPLPQWDAGKPVSGNWGGSTSAVIKGTKNPIAAAKFAEFINTDPESTKMFATQQFLFPATKALLTDPAFTEQKPAFYGGQTGQRGVRGHQRHRRHRSSSGRPSWTRPYTDWNETVGKSLADKSDTDAALDHGSSASPTTPRTRASRSTSSDSPPAPGPYAAAREPALRAVDPHVHSALKKVHREHHHDRPTAASARRARAPQGPSHANGGYLFVAAVPARLPRHAGAAAGLRGVPEPVPASS